MIKVTNLSKYYASKRALGPVSFEIEDGETVGFLGLNGAGKTTALRILACDLRPSSGSVKVDKLDAVSSPHEVRKLIGFLPETTPLYQDMVVTDYLMFAGRIRGMAKPDVKKRIPKVIELTSLQNVAGEPIRNLSHGYRQRVGVAQAIIHEPRLLILDEPTRGLDPVQIVEMRNMIQALKDNHTVLISSHILTEISQTCDRLLVLGRGEIIASGTEESLSSDLLSASRIEVVVEPAEGKSVDDFAAAVTAVDQVEEVTRSHEGDGYWALQASCSEECRPDVVKALVGADWRVLMIDQARNELENIFLRLVEGGSRERN
jgi:ABC-2 type transport system ATP-binding protein